MCVCVGSEDRSEDSTESPASPAAGGPTETRPLHERHLPGQTPLHPKAVHTGRHVSLQDTVKKLVRIVIAVIEAVFSASFLQSSVSHDLQKSWKYAHFPLIFWLL